MYKLLITSWFYKQGTHVMEQRAMMMRANMRGCSRYGFWSRIKCSVRA